MFIWVGNSEGVVIDKGYVEVSKGGLQQYIFGFVLVYNDIDF